MPWQHHALGTHCCIALIRIDHDIWNPDDSTMLLPPDQLHWHGHTMDDAALPFGGKQHLIVDNHRLPLWWDGNPYSLSKLTRAGLDVSLQVPWDTNQGTMP
jgi:hypothetical protein